LSSRSTVPTETVAERARFLTVGDALDPATKAGPLVSERQCTRGRGIHPQGRDDGARLVVGGGRPRRSAAAGSSNPPCSPTWTTRRPSRRRSDHRSPHRVLARWMAARDDRTVSEAVRRPIGVAWSGGRSAARFVAGAAAGLDRRHRRRRRGQHSQPRPGVRGQHDRERGLHRFRPRRRAGILAQRIGVRARGLPRRRRGRRRTGRTIGYAAGVSSSYRGGL
jgi:hypothetical protein